MKDLLNDYEVVEGRCKKCCLNGKLFCTSIFEWVTGEYCLCSGGALQKKKKLVKVTCDRENTKAGDIVTHGISGSLQKIGAVFSEDTPSGYDCVVFASASVSSMDYLGHLCNYTKLIEK